MTEDPRGNAPEKREAASEGREAAPEVELMMELIRHRYASRLTAEQVEAVRATVGRIVRDVQAIRAVRLRSTDEPMPAFVPFRAEP